MRLAEPPLAAAWPDREAAEMVRTNRAASSGNDTVSRVLRLMLAALG